MGFMAFFLELADRAGMLKARRNLKAEGAYRAAWQQYCMSKDPTVREELEHLMDSLQPQIAFCPVDPRWKNFVDSLPGYHEFWTNLYDDTMCMIDDTPDQDTDGLSFPGT